MKRSSITVTVVTMLALTGACAGPAPDASESEAFANTTPPDPPQPVSVVPGSLGGICGVNYINCRTTSTAVAAFTNAARTPVTTASSISWAPSTPVGRVRGTTWTMYVTRLVNDHSLAQDKLQVALTEFDYGSTWNDSGSYQIDYKRNGTVVARAALIKQNNHIRLNVKSIADLYPTMTMNYRKGAAETLLAWYTTPGVAQREQTAIQNGLDQGPNPGIIAGGVPNVACDFGFNGDCFFCKVQKHLGAGILAGIGGGLGAEMGLAAGASMGIAGGGAFIGNMLAELTDCTSRCKSEECTKQWCSCIHSTRPSNQCKPEIETCCMMAEGHLLQFTAGICSGHF
jgi:hypothetical protein